MSPGIDERLVSDLTVSERWLPMAEIVEAEREGRVGQHTPFILLLLAFFDMI